MNATAHGMMVTNPSQHRNKARHPCDTRRSSRKSISIQRPLAKAAARINPLAAIPVQPEWFAAMLANVHSTIRIQARVTRREVRCVIALSNQVDERVHHHPDEIDHVPERRAGLQVLDTVRDGD